MALSVHSPDELIAVIPHLLGFKPEESIVFLPMRSDLPVARVDLPTQGLPRTRGSPSAVASLSQSLHQIAEYHDGRHRNAQWAPADAPKARSAAYRV
ncbi:hypothetical protein BJF80_12290 [Serinicoccus sp. CUA-874]|uniref:DUF4192 family protein n=1 Tax=Serinicoccus sp. CUA-874 TaxID=1517939 RepID=UPI000967105C|nr:DUF4192 family protein [Serinicoccus sp. CUA-874]OLT14746.1 hypothetical protein BJF80_12290 [Serinicoccus sp. CUA-874]